MSIDQTRAAYRVLAVSGFFGPDDNLYELDAEIYYDGEPNEELEPLNELARQRMLVYLEKLDRLGKEVAAKTGKSYAARPRTLDGALELASAVQRSNTAIMGHLKAKENSDAIGFIAKEDVPEVGSAQPKKRGRPLGSTKPKGVLAISA